MRGASIWSSQSGLVEGEEAITYTQKVKQVHARTLSGCAMPSQANTDTRPAKKIIRGWHSLALALWAQPGRGFDGCAMMLLAISRTVLNEGGDGDGWKMELLSPAG